MRLNKKSESNLVDIHLGLEFKGVLMIGKAFACESAHAVASWITKSAHTLSRMTKNSNGQNLPCCYSSST